MTNILNGLMTGEYEPTIKIPDATVPGGYRIENQSSYTPAQLSALVAKGAVLNDAIPPNLMLTWPLTADLPR